MSPRKQTIEDQVNRGSLLCLCIAKLSPAQSLAPLSRAPSLLLSHYKCHVQNWGWLFILTVHSLKFKALGSRSLPFKVLAYFLLFVFPKGRSKFWYISDNSILILETKINEVALIWSFLMYFKVNKDTVQLKTDINHKLRQFALPEDIYSTHKTQLQAQLILSESKLRLKSSNCRSNKIILLSDTLSWD